ncbi:aminoglycoside adenylyltransferase domain-containing protein [Stigmatella erecta]|uniref:aminoglycoside adenylyltransferase domain-containing protein n=1 Tax=Stigmatella erecta TaxID=83460 RepID=UPI000B832E89
MDPGGGARGCARRPRSRPGSHAAIGGRAARAPSHSGIGTGGVPGSSATGRHPPRHCRLPSRRDGRLAEDERNVLLTLALMWRTLDEGTIVAKDEAADWAITRLPRELAEPLKAAQDAYRGLSDDGWSAREEHVSRRTTSPRCSRRAARDPRLPLACMG